MTFHLYIQPQQGEKDIHGILKVKLFVAHDGIVAFGKKGCQTLHELFYFPGTNILDKLRNVYDAVPVFRYIIFREVLYEALAHLAVGKTQSVGLELFVVVFDGQISALVEQRQRVLVHGVDGIEGVRRQILLGDIFQLILCFLQLLHQKGRSPRLVPVVAKLAAAESAQQTVRIV